MGYELMSLRIRDLNFYYEEYAKTWNNDISLRTLGNGFINHFNEKSKASCKTN